MKKRRGMLGALAVAAMAMSSGSVIGNDDIKTPILPSFKEDYNGFRASSNPIPRLLPSQCHTSYAQDKRNSKKIKNRKRN